MQSERPAQRLARGLGKRGGTHCWGPTVNGLKEEAFLSSEFSN